jgi:hypothetical protein
MVDVASGLSFTAPQEKKEKKKLLIILKGASCLRMDRAKNSALADDDEECRHFSFELPYARVILVQEVDNSITYHCKNASYKMIMEKQDPTNSHPT